MNAVTIDNNRYRTAEMTDKESDIEKAMAVMDTMMIKGGKPIPTDATTTLTVSVTTPQADLSLLKDLAQKFGWTINETCPTTEEDL